MGFVFIQEAFEGLKAMGVEANVQLFTVWQRWSWCMELITICMDY